jgi:cell division protein FtsB
MDISIIISVLLSIIGFFAVTIFYQLQKIGKNVEQLMINEAVRKEQLEDLERRVEKIESRNNGYSYGKR